MCKMKLCDLELYYTALCYTAGLYNTVSQLLANVPPAVITHDWILKNNTSIEEGITTSKASI